MQRHISIYITLACNGNNIETIISHVHSKAHDLAKLMALVKISI